MAAPFINPTNQTYSIHISIGGDKFLSKLPNEVLIEIFKSVSGKEIISMKQVNSRFYHLVDINADILPKIRFCNVHEIVEIIFQSDSRAQSKTLTEKILNFGANSRRNIERKLRIARNSCDTCYLDCEKCYRFDPNFFPIENKGKLISLQHYSFDSVKIRRPVSPKAIIEVLKTANNTIKHLHVDINTSPEEIKEIVALFIQNLEEITFEFCDPTVCFNKEFLSKAQKLLEVKLLYCHENRMHIAEKLAQNGIFFENIHFEHCKLSAIHLNAYVEVFLLSEEQQKTINVFVKEDYNTPNFVANVVECVKLVKKNERININSTPFSESGLWHGVNIEIKVGDKKLVLEYKIPVPGNPNTFLRRFRRRQLLD